ncbi:M15 family metallopeptidase, partial [Thermoactinomyces sp. CICC 23799]|uniref:M15 family metallopeptidase n=1 Tax=Thermoactinomyces sp. CICC 23799 TaxID=2767429 RepID=UPI0018DBF0B3
MAMTYASTNQKRISELQPQVKSAAEKALTEAEKAGLDILITDGLRTFAEQNELYAQGRTKPGKIVTNAKAGQSYHNFGL